MLFLQLYGEHGLVMMLLSSEFWMFLFAQACL